MPLRSMTGFARGQGGGGTLAWHWELKSVNGRSLDVRMRLPPGSEFLEPAARDLCTKRLARGNVNATLTVTRTAGATVIKLNEPALLQVQAAAKRARELCPELTPATMDGMLAMRGVLEAGEATESEAEEAERGQAMLATLDKTLDALTADRAREGERLTRVLANQIKEIELHTLAAERSPSRSVERVQARLAEQVQRLAGSSPQLEPERLHQEAMLLAVKADIEEELQRLKSHIAEAESLLSSREPAGRKLDFLTQEFNREANTLCSKSNDTEITKTGLALKLVIDQMREQVQNIE